MDQALLVCLKNGNLQDLRRLVVFYHAEPHLLQLNDINQATPIHLAVKSGDLKMLEYILQLLKGKRIDERERSSCGGLTALHHACLMANVNMIRVLLLSNADVNAKSSGYTQDTPLILCCKKGLFKSAEELIRFQANTQCKDGFGYTAAFWCRRYHREDYIIRLGLGPPLLPTFTDFLDNYKARNNGVFQISKPKKNKPKKGEKGGAKASKKSK